MRQGYHFSWFIIGLLITACTTTPSPERILPTETKPAPTLTLTALVPSVSPTPTPTSTPVPTATPTLVPTPDPARLLAAADSGLARIQDHAGEAALICLRYEDLDSDGESEWLALTHQETVPARLGAFVLDGALTYELFPAFPKPGVADVGLGEYAVCDLQIRDINVDGVPEIAIFGHAQKNETLLHIFAWDGHAYRRLGRFSGDAGVRFVDADGDLEEEIWEGYRDQGSPNLAWYVVHTWENNTYGWTSEHYAWYFLDRPQSYPTHKAQYAVIAFYLALNDRDLPGAYDLLLPADDREYEVWALGYTTTIRVSVGGVHPIPVSVTEDSERIAAMVTSWDNEGGVILGRLWDVEWDTVRTGEGWRLSSATAQLLEEWVVDYWP